MSLNSYCLVYLTAFNISGPYSSGDVYSAFSLSFAHQQQIFTLPNIKQNFGRVVDDVDDFPQTSLFSLPSRRFLYLLGKNSSTLLWHILPPSPLWQREKWMLKIPIWNLWSNIFSPNKVYETKNVITDMTSVLSPLKTHFWDPFRAAI